jgi:hypothetical protein
LSEVRVKVVDPVPLAVRVTLVAAIENPGVAAQASVPENPRHKLKKRKKSENLRARMTESFPPGRIHPA